jgi:antitoxin VapB
MVSPMSVQIANPEVIAKIERLCRLTGLGKTAAVNTALDRMLDQIGNTETPDPWAGCDALIAQLHRLPPRLDSFEAVRYDDAGLPT